MLQDDFRLEEEVGVFLTTLFVFGFSISVDFSPSV